MNDIHPGIFRMIAHVPASLKRFPAVVALPTSQRSFSPQWDLHPVHQNVCQVVEIRDWPGRPGERLRGAAQNANRTEHLNQSGRRLLTQRIVAALQQASDETTGSVAK